jgi:16S rRNA (guanine966-N2)-methyltransferase
MVRITGGRYRGRRLEVPRGIRPTTEVARKAAFDILGSRVAGASVLDACAGTGAYGLEALSRGAVRATFVESDRGAGAVLKGNVSRLGAEAQSAVELRPVAAWTALAGTGRAAARFDLIFHDPPFGDPAAEDLAALLGLLAPGGTLVHERGDDRIPEVGRAPVDVRRYGRTRLLFYAAPA